MKLIKQQARKLKPKEETPKKQGIPKITQSEQDSVDQWLAEHRKHIQKAGVVTSAWFGLQWGSCPDYIHIQCGCGATYIRETYQSKPVYSSGRLPEMETKNLGE